MQKIYFILTIALFVTTSKLQAQNDSIYFWKNNVMIHKQSVKAADLDSITFRRPVNPTGINIPGPTVTDIDGNAYQSVTNCGITWMKSNLNVSRYSDGTPIPQVTDPVQWVNLTTGAWCYYNNDSANGAVYGKLYNWYAVAGIYDAASAANPALRKKLAPNGWHIPSSEWSQLNSCLGGVNISGGKMKATGTLQEGNGFWQDPNAGATNESGFTGLPGGFCNFNFGINTFFQMGDVGLWWDQSDGGNTFGFNWNLSYLSATLQSGPKNKITGLSVRCVKD